MTTIVSFEVPTLYFYALYSYAIQGIFQYGDGQPFNLKATERYFLVVLIVTLHKALLILNQQTKSCHSNKRKVLSCGVTR